MIAHHIFGCDEKGGLAVAKSEALEQVLAVAMEAGSESVFAADELDGKQLDQVAQQMTRESEADEGAAYDERIARGLKQIEDEMRKEL